MSIRIWMCKNCGCEFPDEATSVPRVVPCPKCGDAVLLAKTKSVESDSKSFWAGFFFGWWGVLWAGFSKGRRGIDHAVAYLKKNFFEYTLASAKLQTRFSNLGER